MSHYRLYFMNNVNGHIDRAQDLEADGDKEAVGAAKALLANSPIELWCGTRKVQRFETPSTAFLERYRAHKAMQEQQAKSKSANLADMFKLESADRQS